MHGNGEDWDPMGMGVRSAMGWEWKLSAWEWELRRGSSYIVTWTVMRVVLQPGTEQVVLN